MTAATSVTEMGGLDAPGRPFRRWLRRRQLDSPVAAATGELAVFVSCQHIVEEADPATRSNDELNRLTRAAFLLSLVGISPCRAALMSGRHEFKNGVTHTILERERWK